MTLVLFSSVLAFVSCKPDGKPEQAPVVAPASVVKAKSSATASEGKLVLRMKINGVEWIANQQITAYLSSEGTLNFAGQKDHISNNVSGQLSKPGSIGTPTEIKDGMFRSLTITLADKPYVISETMGKGTITITEIKPAAGHADQPLVRGTFSGNAIGPGGAALEITDGQFAGF
jgi:hypothetical protein